MSRKEERLKNALSALGIEGEYTEATVKKQYRKLALKWHPYV